MEELVKKIAIIINNKAKNASLIENYLKEFAAAGFVYELYQIEPNDLVITIKKCVVQYRILLVGGGDGTIRTAAQYCINQTTILGVIALGTLNHFAKELDLPTNPAELIACLHKSNTQMIDVAEVNGFVFINNSSIGFYPKFAKKRDYYTKKWNKWLSYIPGFIESFKNHEVFALQIKNEGITLSLYTSFLMISNNLYTYEFPSTFKRVSFINNLLGLYYFKHGKIQFFKLIRFWFNKKKNFNIKEFSQPIEIHFAKQKEVLISLDGDTVKVSTPLYYKSLPLSLKLLVKS